MNEQQLAAVKQALSVIRACQEYKMGLSSFVEAADNLEQAIKQDALDKKAENARELGLSYEATPVQSLQCAHCQVTIETLNDKAVYLINENQRLRAELKFNTTPAPKEDLVDLAVKADNWGQP
jgi:hypothetical protein